MGGSIRFSHMREFLHWLQVAEPMINQSSNLQLDAIGYRHKNTDLFMSLQGIKYRFSLNTPSGAWSPWKCIRDFR